MASYTLSSDPRFPAGTTLNVYRGTGGLGVVSNTPVTSAVVAADSTVTFTGLDRSVYYLAGETVAGPFTSFRLPAQEVESGGTAPVAMVEGVGGYAAQEAGRPWFGWTDPTAEMDELDIYYAIPEPD